MTDGEYTAHMSYMSDAKRALKSIDHLRAAIVESLEADPNLMNWERAMVMASVYRKLEDACDEFWDPYPPDGEDQ